MRPRYEELHPAEWTEEEAYQHLSKTFDHACEGWPDVMEPYLSPLVEAKNDVERKDIMRRALRETIGKRG